MSALGGVNGTVCNEQQYQLSLSSPDNPNPPISCLSHGQTIGLAFTSEVSFLSIAAVVLVYTLILRNYIRYKNALPNGDWKLLQVPADIYMFALFFFEIFQALGGALDAKWAHDGIVTSGTFCTAQGIIQQFGEVGVGLVTLLLGLHTFITALWRVGLHARWVAGISIALVVVFLTLWIGLGDGLNKHYITPTPYWCWISSHYTSERLGGEYVWLWVTLFSSVILYVPLYFWAEGRLSVDKEKWYQFRISQSDVEDSQRRAALRLLLYPIAYCLVVLPLSVARWSQSPHRHVPSAASFFACMLWNLSGAINVTVFLLVRPQLLLFTPPEVLLEPEIELAPATINSAIESYAFNHGPRSGKPFEDDLGKTQTSYSSRNSMTLSRQSSKGRSVVNGF
ncbi:hypothetical protein BGW80DRAFT_1165386 [Lactifluus volemus]|nr:hypothetical protein BGW80DRAFT_1165386 [Lactifluus volemus]